MSRLVQPMVMVDENVQYYKTLIHRGPHNERARGGATRGTLRVWCPRAGGARVCQEQRQRRTPLVPRTGQSNSAGIGREVPTDHEAQGQICSDDCRSQESEVAGRADEHQPRGEMAKLTRRPSTAVSGSEGVQTQWPGSPWNQGLTT